MSTLRRVVAWPAWSFVVAADSALSSAAVVGGYDFERWALVLMLSMSAVGWLLLGLRALEDRRMRGCAP